MGATTFIIESSGKTAREAFNSAVEDAQWESGHGGYTGTIAEKAGRGFTMITPNPVKLQEHFKNELKNAKEELKKRKANGGCWIEHLERRVKLLTSQARRKRFEPMEIANALIDMGDRRIDDKWGPAGCIDLTPKLTGKRKPKRFLFFGWASE